MCVRERERESVCVCVRTTRGLGVNWEPGGGGGRAWWGGWDGARSGSCMSVCNVCAHVYVLVRVRLCAHVSVYESSRSRVFVSPKAEAMPLT